MQPASQNAPASGWRRSEDGESETEHQSDQQGTDRVVLFHGSSPFNNWVIVFTCGRSEVDLVDKESLGEWMCAIEQNKVFVQSEVGLPKGER